MNNIRTTYPILIRSAWLAMMVFTLVFCGPIKKLIEMRMDGPSTTTSQTIDKKLRTSYREKRDIAPLVQVVAHQSDSDLVLFFASSFILSILLLLTNSASFKPKHSPVAITQGIPLYLHLRKMRI